MPIPNSYKQALEMLDGKDWINIPDRRFTRLVGWYENSAIRLHYFGTTIVTFHLDGDIQLFTNWKTKKAIARVNEAFVKMGRVVINKEGLFVHLNTGEPPFILESGASFNKLAIFA